MKPPQNQKLGLFQKGRVFMGWANVWQSCSYFPAAFYIFWGKFADFFPDLPCDIMHSLTTFRESLLSIQLYSRLG